MYWKIDSETDDEIATVVFHHQEEMCFVISLFAGEIKCCWTMFRWTSWMRKKLFEGRSSLRWRSSCLTLDVVVLVVTFLCFLACWFPSLDLSIKASSDLQEVKSDDDDAKTVEFVVMMEETLERLETAVGILESSSLWWQVYQYIKGDDEKRWGNNQCWQDLFSWAKS